MALRLVHGSRLVRRPPPAHRSRAQRRMHAGMVAQSCGPGQRPPRERPPRGLRLVDTTGPSRLISGPRRASAARTRYPAPPGGRASKTKGDDAMRIVDLSMTVEECDSAPFAKDEYYFKLKPIVKWEDKGFVSNMVEMTVHAGTHIDSPHHFSLPHWSREQLELLAGEVLPRVA